MTALNKHAELRKELLNPAIGSNHHLRKLALSLLDELETSQTERDEFRSRLKLERAILADAEKRISDLETKKADLMAHVLNGYEATALTMTLRKMDVYLPDYLRFCAIYGVDHDAIMDKLDYQSFVLARVNNDDLRQDIEASHD